MTPLTPLPIDDHIERIVDLVRRNRAAVVTAAPGAGKTTRVPPALAADGPLLLLQPRRVAARAIAQRIAEEQAWTLGREVGWHVRFDRRSTAETRLLVVTEGILTARLQQDPLLDGVRTIVIDEFHERSIHADLGLALARQAWLAREDLRIVVMSATLEAHAVSRFLGGCPVIEVPGRTFPVDVRYAPGLALEDAVRQWRQEAAPSGAVLCFLPGAGEIRRAAEALSKDDALRQVPVLPLHGSLGAEAQDAALKAGDGRRIVLSTNVAETTLTVPDVAYVIDSGYQKTASYDAERGIDSLQLERVAQDSADQRAGRAGRTRPGVAIRLWDRRDRLRPHRRPEIARVDLIGPALDVLVWGGDPRTFEWFEAPPPQALDAAIRLLGRLGALDDRARVTPRGRDLQRLPLHPRLATLFLAAGGSREAALACALLAERSFLPARRHATTCDLLAVVEHEADLPGHVRAIARDLQARASSVVIDAGSGEERFRRAVLAAYPDRVARRRAPNSDRLVLASGTGARLARESGVSAPEFLVAVDVAAATSASAGEALVRIATGIERRWLAETHRTVVHRLGDDGIVRASEEERYDRLVVAERACAADPEAAARLLAAAYLAGEPPDRDRQLLRRLAFASVELSFEDLVRAAAAGRTALDQIDLDAHVPAALRRQLEREAPATLRVPSGRDVPIDYREAGPFVAVKLQELFGLADTPRIGRRGEPVTFELLAPNGRPVQITRDLRSFWTRGYLDVRRELRARYPKHPWPEDPWTATPTRRTRK